MSIVRYETHIFGICAELHVSYDLLAQSSSYVPAYSHNIKQNDVVK